ncbi:hypothetical protein J4Q44_G00095830 [Coregonus suidteri]|uniref:Uncharacterized protein n=1 Tax=Coregonus suidteri TaxID=861788 RepID=A0AAN8MZK0_9TELE
MLLPVHIDSIRYWRSVFLSRAKDLPTPSPFFRGPVRILVSYSAGQALNTRKSQVNGLALRCLFRNNIICCRSAEE